MINLKDNTQFTALAIIGIIAVGALVVSFGGMATGDTIKSYYKPMIERGGDKITPSGDWCYYTGMLKPDCTPEYRLTCRDTREAAERDLRTVAGIRGMEAGFVYAKDDPKLQSSMPRMTDAIQDCLRRLEGLAVTAPAPYGKDTDAYHPVESEAVTDDMAPMVPLPGRPTPTPMGPTWEGMPSDEDRD